MPAIRLDARLSLALHMLKGARVVADIGCDHGRLACALIQQGAAERVIASDISAASLDKARALVARCGLAERVETRLGDGLRALRPGEAEAAALLGMGGTLMAGMLEAADAPFQGAARILFQPMRAAEDIRRWLYRNGCRILDDRMAEAGGRLYQLILASPPSPARDELPEGWPEGFFKLGYTAFCRREPLFLTAVYRMLARHEARLARGEAPALGEGAA
ncbi:MAG: class I SAM-dependent methyltransferase [Clostridia bacterium]|nr:class I SAM-dependent methyltransferase [Clostridia bacterium]